MDDGRDTVTNGAQLIVVQTNNATFNEAEARQQLAMVRLRAVEHGRDALMASTVGVSAFVDAHGNVSDANGFFVGAVIERTLLLRPSRTMATRLGVIPELALAGMAVGFLIAALVLRRRRSPGFSERPATPSGVGGDSTTNIPQREDGSNRAELAAASVGMQPLDAVPYGAVTRAVVDEAKG
jgi:hypothetical protein